MYYLFIENLHLDIGIVCYFMFTLLFTIQLVLQMVHFINEHTYQCKYAHNISKLQEKQHITIHEFHRK
jgi:hypothetical protein